MNRLAKQRWGGVAALTAALAASMGAGRTEGEAAVSGRVAFQEVTQGSRGSNLAGERTSAGARVLRTRSQAARVLGAWGLDTGATKSVNFDRDSLIVVLAEYQPTGGYRARISRVVVQGREAVVTGRIRYEGGEFATQSIERPWVVVALKRAALAGVRGEARIRLRSQPNARPG